MTRPLFTLLTLLTLWALPQFENIAHAHGGSYRDSLPSVAPDPRDPRDPDVPPEDAGTLTPPGRQPPAPPGPTRPGRSGPG
jgi:hypothetical protein